MASSGASTQPRPASATGGHRSPPVNLHLLADYAGSYRGSFIPMLAALARHGRECEWSTTFWLSEVARDRPWLAELEDVGQIRWLPGEAGVLDTTRTTLRALGSAMRRQRGSCVLHSHFTTFDIPTALARLARRDVHVFWHEHSRVRDDRVTRLRNSIRLGTLGPWVERILCVSPEILADLRNRRAPRGKLLNLPNAVDTGYFSPPADDVRSAARAALGVGPGARVVLHFGWDWLRKGGDVMLEAASQLRPVGEVVWLTVVPDGGAAVDADIAASPAVRRIGAAEDTRALYAAADVFLSCSRAEGMPYAMLEALASGLPVVASDLPGQSPLLQGLPGGRIVELEPEAVATGVRELLALPDEQRRLHTRAARETVERRYSLDAWTREVFALYREALAHNATAL